MADAQVSLLIRAQDAASRVFDNVRATVQRGAAAMANTAGQAFDTIAQKADAAATAVAGLAGEEAKLKAQLDAAARAADTLNTELQANNGRLRATPTAGTTQLGPATPAAAALFRTQRLYREELTRSLDAVEQLQVRTDVANADARAGLLENIRQQRAWMSTVGATRQDFERLSGVMSEFERRSQAAGVSLQQVRPPAALLGFRFPPALTSGIQRFGVVTEGVLARVASGARAVRNAFFSIEAAVLGVGVGAALGYLVSVNREYQRLTTQIKAFTGDERVARGVFAEIQRFAVALPFELDQITRAYISLQSMGLTPTEERMTRLSNLASAMAVDLDALAHAMRRALAGEMDPLESAVAGSTFRLRGDEILATFNGVTTKIRKDAAALAKYLDGIAEQFPTASEDRMKSLDGAISTLSDSFFGLAIKIGEAGLNAELQQAAANMTALSNGAQENERQLRVWTVTGIESARTIGATFRFAAFGIYAILKTLVGTLGAFIAGAVGGITGLFAFMLNGLTLLGRAVNQVVEWRNKLADTALGRRLGLELMEPIRAFDVFNKAQAELERRSKAAMDAAPAVMRSIGDTWRSAADAATDLVDVVNKGNAAIERAKTEPLNTQESGGALALEGDARFQRIQALRADATGKDAAKRAAALRELTALQKQYREQLAQETLAGVAANRQLAERVRLAALHREAVAAERAATGGGPSGTGAPKDPIMDRIKALAAATRHEETRAAALEELAAIERREATAAAARTGALDEQVRHLERLGAIEEAREDAIAAQIEQLGLMVAVESTRATALGVLEFMERGLTRQLQQQAAAGEDLTRTWERLQRVRQAKGGFETGPDGQPREAATSDKARAARATTDRGALDALADQSVRRALGTGLPDLRDLDEDIRQTAVQLDIYAREHGVLPLLSRIAEGLRGNRTEGELLNDTIEGIAETLIGGYASAVQGAFAAFAEGSGSAGDAFLGAMVGAIGAAAKALGDFFMAKSIAAFAEALLPPPLGNPAAAGAGAGFLAAATAFYALSGMMQGGANALGGGGGGGGGAGFASGQDNTLQNAERGTATVIWEGDHFDPRDPAQLERFAKVREQVGNRRMIIRTRGKRVR